jgi:tetratricopeptide (TPR) repeat protein
MSTESAAPDAGPHATVRALLREAEQSFERAQAAAAITLAEQAVALARECNELSLLGWGLMLLGSAQNHLGQPVQAYASASEAYELLGACGDVERQLRALSTCAGVSYMYGDPDRAIDLVRKGLAASAHRPDCAAIRAALLVNLAISLYQDATEYAEAIQCSADAVALAAQAPGTPGLRIRVATRLAYAHVYYADRLGDQGKHGEAAAQLEAASDALPPLDFRSWRTFSHPELLALPYQAVVLAALGRWPMARRAAAATLWSMRKSGSRRLAQVNQLESLADLHRRAGLLHRSIHYEVKMLAACDAVGNKSEAGRCLQRLAKLHAQTGAFDLALACHKQLAAVRGLLRLETSALRCRLATIEREADRRRYQAHEALAHTQRLAAIGRLIAQTHHALSTPAERSRCLTAKARELSHQSASPAALATVLDDLSQTMDRAAGLVSQLKLFSYRSTPQPMALSLRDALLDAWQGLGPHVNQRIAQIEVTDDRQLQAWGDAQRLGIMLKVLSIELAHLPGSDAAPTLIRARIEAGEAATVVLHIEAWARAAPATPGETPAALGIALSEEIAAEMGGSLQTVRDDDTALHHPLHQPLHYRLHYLLQLPEAGARVRELPGLVELR